MRKVRKEDQEEGSQEEGSQEEGRSEGCEGGRCQQARESQEDQGNSAVCCQSLRSKPLRCQSVQGSSLRCQSLCGEPLDRAFLGDISSLGIRTGMTLAIRVNDHEKARAVLEQHRRTSGA